MEDDLSEPEDEDSNPPDSDSDAEMPYESVPRARRASWDSDQNTGVERLPIKLSNGKIQKTGVKFRLGREEADESDDEVAAPPPTDTGYKPEDIATGARFGRRSVVEVVTTKSRKARIHGAKEQLASICQEIVSDPENSVRPHPSFPTCILLT